MNNKQLGMAVIALTVAVAVFAVPLTLANGGSTLFGFKNMFCGSMGCNSDSGSCRMGEQQCQSNCNGSCQVNGTCIDCDDCTCVNCTCTCRN